MIFKNMTHTISQKMKKAATIAILSLAVIVFAVFVDFLHAAHWIGPGTNQPPTTPSTIGTPLNNSGNAQVKNASLGVGDISVTGDMRVQNAFGVATTGIPAHPVDIGDLANLDGDPDTFDGIRFPDGTVQTSANPPADTFVVSTWGTTTQGSPPIDLGTTWRRVLIHGAREAGDVSGGTAYVFREGANVRFEMMMQPGIHFGGTLNPDGTKECITGWNTCFWLDASTGSLIYENGPPTGFATMREAYLVLE